jgi:hypothetical protein
LKAFAAHPFAGHESLLVPHSQPFLYKPFLIYAYPLISPFLESNFAILHFLKKKAVFQLLDHRFFPKQ